MPLLLVSLAALAIGHAVQGTCANADAPAGTFIVGAVSARQDSTIRLSVCLATPAGRRVGSYHGELLFSPATARVVSVESPRDGLRADNALVPGKVSFAGAIPNGIGTDAILTVVLRPSTAGVTTLAGARLRIVELNDTAGIDVLGATRVDSMIGAPAEVAPIGCGRRPRVGRPILERLSPAAVSVTARAVALEILGCGFDSTNVVIVGERRIAGVTATHDGTRLRLTVPLAAPGGGEVSPMPPRAGATSVIVSNAHGRSNALALVLQ